ncbi:MAG: AAA family ATPase [Pirellulales bacterium]|nr:AAA family ATPase [Pirellulales bacterium]
MMVISPEQEIMIDQANELRQLIRQQTEQLTRAASTRPRIIAVTGGKGGVGTTTVATHLAIAMSRQSDRVLLVDADPDRADVATLCGLATDYDLADLVEARRTLDEVIAPGPNGILVLTGAGRAAATEPSTDRFHQRWIRAAREAEEPFDCVVVDTGNRSARSVKMLWEASDLVLLVTTIELPSIIDTYASIKTLAKRTSPPAIHTLINRVTETAVAYDAHGRLARAVWRFLGFHLDSAGHVMVGQDLSANLADQDLASSESLWAREFNQLARTMRIALRGAEGRDRCIFAERSTACFAQNLPVPLLPPEANPGTAV